MFRLFFSGLAAYGRVPGTLVRHGLWPYQLIPAVISLFLALGLFAACWFSAGAFYTWVDGLIDVSVEWVDKALSIGLAILAFLVLLAAFVFVHKHLALILLSPFLGRIAEETVKAVKGPEFAQSELSFMQSLSRSTSVNLRYIARELLANILYLLCGVVPLIGSLITAVGMFLNQSKYLGYGLMDFPLEHRGLTAGESDQFVRRHRALSTGLGAGYLLFMLVPFIGWMFAPTFGTVAGTLKALETLEEEESGGAA